MPRMKSGGKESGWDSIAKRSAEAAKRREEAESRIREFWLADGEEANVQFLDDEPYCFDGHQIKDGRGNWKFVPCQLTSQKHCLMCREGIKVSWKAAFKILDYRGNWDSKKKEFKHDEPVEKLWVVGPTLAQQLKSQIDKRKKPLTAVVLNITRSGSGAKDTTYNIEQAFDEDDVRLKPISHKTQYPAVEDLCKPMSDEELDDLGFSAE